MNNKGCVFLESGINFDLNTVCDCCISHSDGRGLPVLIENYHGEMIDWESLFEKKQQRINNQKQKTIYECEGCYHLNNYEFKNIKKISEFHFSHCRVCNANCIYCSDEYSKGDVNYNTYPVIKDLIDKNMYLPGGEATFQGGEPTLMKNFDELVQLLTQNGTLARIHTSAIRYSNTVAQALKENKASIVISLDSGTEETYKKIKQVNMFHKVLENIKNYESNAQNINDIIIKYIIIPGINDNIKEIDNFFKLINELKIKTIAVDIEVQYARKYNNKDVSPHIYLIYDYFEKTALKYNINLLTYSFLSYVLNNRQTNKTFLINNKFLFVWYLNANNDRTKNINYIR